MIRTSIEKTSSLVNNFFLPPESLWPRLLPGCPNKRPRGDMNLKGYPDFPPTSIDKLLEWIAIAEASNEPKIVWLVRTGDIGDGTGRLFVLDRDIPNPWDLSIPSDLYVRQRNSHCHFYFWMEKKLPFGRGKLIWRGQHIGELKSTRSEYVVAPGQVFRMPGEDTDRFYQSSDRLDSVLSSNVESTWYKSGLETVPPGQFWEFLESLGQKVIVKPGPQSNRSLSLSIGGTTASVTPLKCWKKPESPNPFQIQDKDLPQVGERHDWLKRVIRKYAIWNKQTDPDVYRSRIVRYAEYAWYRIPNKSGVPKSFATGFANEQATYLIENPENVVRQIGK